jgi:hypothetical protein
MMEKVARKKRGQDSLIERGKKLSPTLSRPKRLQTPTQFIDWEGRQQIGVGGDGHTHHWLGVFSL